jgi:UDP-N-acetylglucosamine--N-acetylmuramyl-(pentapeptide) pyrophosphoryl-undecaprenol N-acetylglucosamine transferase
MKRIIITGGGTAGHAYPVIIVGKKLAKNHRVKLIYVGTRGIERKLAREAQLPFFAIYTGKHRDYFSFLNFLDIFKIIFGIIQAFFLFIFFRPNLVFAKGGYVTYPILFWARAFKTPYVIHESDAVMGRANLSASKKAKKICLGFPINFYYQYNKTKIPMEKLVYTGIPLRPDFFEKHNQEKNTRPTILITGGSQGAVKINETIETILPDLLKIYNIIHITGSRDFAKFKKQENKENYKLYEFTDKMPDLMQQSDIVVTRAGANTLAEISALSKPSILIPLPSASKDHQAINAKIYAEKNAALVLTEKSLTSGSLLSIINRLMEDENLLKIMGHHANEFASQDATADIINILFEVK